MFNLFEFCATFPYFSNIAEIKWPMNNEIMWIMWVKGVYHSQRSPQILESFPIKSIQTQNWNLRQNRPVMQKNWYPVYRAAWERMYHWSFFRDDVTFGDGFSDVQNDVFFVKNPWIGTWKWLQLLMVQKSCWPVEVGSLSHYLLGFIHPRWCRISSINSSTVSYFRIIRDPKQKKETNVDSTATCWENLRLTIIVVWWVAENRHSSAPLPRLHYQDVVQDTQLLILKATMSVCHPHTIHVWYIYLYLWLMFMAFM